MLQSKLLVIIALSTQLTTSAEIIFEFRENGTEEPLSELPEEDDQKNYELYVKYTEFKIDTHEEVELEETSEPLEWASTQQITVSIELYLIEVELDKNPFIFHSQKLASAEYSDLSMSDMCEELNALLETCNSMNRDFVFSLDFKKMGSAEYKIKIMSFNENDVVSMQSEEMCRKTDFKFEDDRLVLL